MSDTHAPLPEEAGIGYEPDEIPINFLLVLAAAVTVGAIGMVTFTVVYFKQIVAEEYIAKGYSERVEESAPRGDWQ